MTQEQINLLLGFLAGSPIVLYIVQQFYLRRKNKITDIDSLMDVQSKMATSLKQAREDLSALEQELRTNDIEHRNDVEALENQWKEKQDRMKTRIAELEKTIVKYDISFTLTTNPTVQVTDMKVIGKEDVMASQRMRAITNQKDKK